MTGYAEATTTSAAIWTTATRRWSTRWPPAGVARSEASQQAGMQACGRMAARTVDRDEPTTWHTRLTAEPTMLSVIRASHSRSEVRWLCGRSCGRHDQVLTGQSGSGMARYDVFLRSGRRG